MNGQPFSQNPRKRGKKPPQSDTILMRIDKHAAVVVDTEDFFKGGEGVEESSRSP